MFSSDQIIKKNLPASVICPLFSVLCLLLLAASACAEEAPKPDDTVIYDISGEDWVTTKTAHVTLDVEASVSAANAGTMRADMFRAVNDTAKSDWRLINFSRSQDQTGLERWSVIFETRLPEANLGGLADAAKKASKAGMQVAVGGIDFNPTLDETETVRANLRVKLFKQIGDQLASLNSAMSGRAYRVAQITFDANNDHVARPRPIFPPRMMAGAMMAQEAPQQQPSDDVERSERLTMAAHVTFAALPPTAASAVTTTR